jgi:hypothetical protein
MNEINNGLLNIAINSSYTINKNLVLVGREVKWMSQKEIRNAKMKGAEIVESLETILELVKYIEIEGLDGEQLLNLMTNFYCLGKKIEQSYSELINVDPLDSLFILDSGLVNNQPNLQILKSKIDAIQVAYLKCLYTEPSAEKIIPLLKRFIQAPHLLNKFPQLAVLLVRYLQQNPSIEIISELGDLWEFFPQPIKDDIALNLMLIPLFRLEKKIHCLLKASFNMLHFYYMNRSFAEDLLLEESSLQEVDPETLKLQSKLLLYVINEGIEKVREEMLRTPILRTLYGIHMFIPLNEKEETCINEFIENNKKLLAAGFTGKESRKRPEIRKIKAIQYNLPRNLEYNTANGDIVVNLGQIGRGTYKTVILKMFWNSSEMRAISKTVLKDLNIQYHSKREFLFLYALKGKPNVLQIDNVKIYKSKKGESIQTFVSPYFNMNSLRSCMNKLTELEKYQVSIDIIRGLLEVHKVGIIHRDIKPENILIHKTKIGNRQQIQAVIADFGVSCWASWDLLSHFEIAGTKSYMAPELKTRVFALSFNNDLWSLGAVLAELFPKEELLNDSQFSNKESVRYVIDSFLQKEPTERMPLAEALFIFEKQFNRQTRKARL